MISKNMSDIRKDTTWISKGCKDIINKKEAGFLLAIGSSSKNARL